MDHLCELVIVFSIIAVWLWLLRVRSKPMVAEVVACQSYYWVDKWNELLDRPPEDGVDKLEQSLASPKVVHRQTPPETSPFSSI
jgi:hypothetical protein